MNFHIHVYVNKKNQKCRNSRLSITLKPFISFYFSNSINGSVQPHSVLAGKYRGKYKLRLAT